MGVAGVSMARAEIVWLRRTGNSNPNGTGLQQCGSLDSGGGAFVTFTFTNNTATPLKLDHGQTGVSAFDFFGLKTSGLYANAWSQAGFEGGNPLGPGDIINHFGMTQPTITTVGNSSVSGIPITNYLASWNESGALRLLNLVIQPGQTVLFGLAVDMQGINSGGYWLQRESSVMLPSDRMWTSALGYDFFSAAQAIQYTGYAEGDWAFVPVFRMGDVNCDSVRNVLDVGPFVEALIDPTAYVISFPDCGLLSADMNGDGRVDGLDIAGFTDCLLAGECP